MFKIREFCAQLYSMLPQLVAHNGKDREDQFVNVDLVSRLRFLFKHSAKAFDDFTCTETVTFNLFQRVSRLFYAWLSHCKPLSGGAGLQYNPGYWLIDLMSDGRQKDARCRDAIHVSQLGHCPLQFSRSFHHPHLKFVVGFANFLLGPAPFVNQVRAAERCRRMIHSYGEQHPVSFGWEVATLAADGNNASVRVEPDRNNDTA
jgi:hypothetical protein